MFPLSPLNWLYVIAAVVFLTLGAALKIQTSRLDSVKAEYTGFVSTVKAQGEIAKKAADIKAQQDKQLKEQADRENQSTISSLHADIKRLRNARTSGSFLPPAAPSAKSPDRACFDRTLLESAIRTLDSEVSVLVESGDEARVNLDTGKKWALTLSTTLGGK